MRRAGQRCPRLLVSPAAPNRLRDGGAWYAFTLFTWREAVVFSTIIKTGKHTFGRSFRALPAGVSVHDTDVKLKRLAFY